MVKRKEGKIYATNPCMNPPLGCHQRHLIRNFKQLVQSKRRMFPFLFFFLIGKLHTHPMGIESATSPSTLPLQGEEVPFELELIGADSECFHKMCNQEKREE